MALRHETVVAWQRADDLFISVHRLTLQRFPPIERFELASQVRRAAYSVPANIVEGFARRHRRARLHFFNIAEASLAEVTYGIHAARRLGYLSQEVHDRVRTEASRVGAPLTGLIRATRAMPAIFGDE